MSAKTSRSDGLDRVCRLCGEALATHFLPTYGVNDPRAGKLGIICPSMQPAPAPAPKPATPAQPEEGK